MSWQGMIVALRAECFVLLRNGKLAFFVTIPAFASVLHILLIRINTSSEKIRQSISDGANTPANQDFAYGYWVDGISTGLTLVYLLFIGFAAYSFAIDRDNGVLRHLTIRQSSRTTLVFAKFISLHLVAGIACFLVFVSSLVLCSALWDFSAVIEDGYELISRSEIEFEIRTGLLLALIPLPACLCLGLLFSVVANSTLQAITLALGASLLLDIFKGALGDTAHFLYANFQPSLLDASYLSEVAQIVRGFSDILIDERMMQLNYWVPIPQALVFLSLALFLVKRKSL